MKKQIWRDICDEMRAHHAGLIWRVENIEDVLDQNPGKKEQLNIRIDCFREIIEFVSDQYIN